MRYDTNIHPIYIVENANAILNILGENIEGFNELWFNMQANQQNATIDKLAKWLTQFSDTAYTQGQKCRVVTRNKNENN